MYGDGTMRSGSAVTLVATGTPTNTVENGWPVRTYTSAQNDQEPANVAFPASDFSVCYHRRNVALPNTQIMAFGTSGLSANFSALPFELQTNGTLTSVTSDGVVQAAFNFSSAPLPIVAGAWNVLCFTYQRVGGAANNVGTLYDGTTMEGPAGLRAAILKKKDGFLLSFTESFMTYALGRRIEAADMPAVRKVLRGAEANNYALSAFVQGIVQSPAFQMNTEAPVETTTAPAAR